MNQLKLDIGPERIILPEALQPFLIHTKTGRLVVTGQLPVPLGTQFPGVYGTAASDDGGQTWKDPGVPGGSPFHEGCVAHLRDGTTLLLQWSARGPDSDGNWIAKLWESRDWKTLTGPFDAKLHLPDAKGGFDDDGHPVPEVFLHRGLIALPNDDLLLAAYGWFKGDDTPSTYRPSMKKFRVILLRSKDRGRNFSLVTTVAVDPSIGEEGFNEPVLLRLTKGKRAGRLLALLRTGSNKTFQHCPLYQTESDDEGKTWTTPHALAFGNVDPDLIELHDGTLVASYGWRTWQSRVHLGAQPPKEIGPEHGNYLAFSYDQGDTWPQVVRVNHEPSSCYTCVCEIEPNKLLFIYDKGDAWQHVWKDYPESPRSISCRTIKLQLL
jgi:hypothetical protein